MAVLAVAMLAGCGTGSAGEPSPTPDTSAYFAGLIARATAGGAAPEQIAVLTDAAELGEFTSSHSQELAALMADCISDAGFEATVEVWEPWPGIVASTVVWRPSDGDQPTSSEDALVTNCQARFYDFGTEAMMSQPVTLELLDSKIEEERPEVLACLRDRGVVIDDDISAPELRDAVFANMARTGEEPCAEWN